MAEGENQMNTPAARSMLRDFVGSISTMRGDLSTITAPPFVLDTKSTVEMPQYWSENPSIFCAPAQSDDPAERAMLVLRWFLSSLRGQNYMGHSEDHGVKKPLNAFLGEVFLAKWEDSMGTTRLVSEQVSHHPPITACRVWNDEHGVEASGYTRQTITFSGAVTIKQTGHALFNLSKHNESYLIPLPELKVRGILSGTLYPELNGKYYLPSTSGYTSVIDFSGKGWFGTGRKHSLEAKVYKEEDGESNPIYTIKGTWNQEFVIHDVRKGEDIETFDVLKQSTQTTPLSIEPLEDQDPWESRRAWKDVISALNRGDMKGTVEAKSKVEQGQREMRKAEKQTNKDFQLRFFRTLSDNEDNKAATLSCLIPGNDTSSLAAERNDTKGVWTFDYESWSEGKLTKPYHEEMVPNNSHAVKFVSTDNNTNNLHDSEDLSPPRSKRSSLDSATSVPSLSASINSESSTRPASPSSSMIENIQNTQPRRSLDAFRHPFRTNRDRDRKSRLSVDFSSFTNSKQSSSPSSSPSQSPSPSPHHTQRDSTPTVLQQTSTKSPLTSQINQSSQPHYSTSSLSIPTSDQIKDSRSKSLNMSIQEQLNIETMLRDKYSNSSSLTSSKQKHKHSSSGSRSTRRSGEFGAATINGNGMQRKSRLSIDSGMYT